MYQKFSSHRQPIYLKLAALLEDLIRSESLRAGDRVPSVRQFSRQQRVSVPTALQAYATLETRGLISARPKSGFFVCPRQADLVREPSYAITPSKVTDVPELSPIDSLLADHSNQQLVPLGAAVPSGDLLPGEKLARTIGSIARRLGPRSIAPGPLFSAQNDFQNYIRLNCGHPWSPQIERSIGILGHLVKRLAR